MNNRLEEAFDEIDAAVFSGDSFLNTKNLAKLRYFIERWERETMSCDSCKYVNSINCIHCSKGLEEKVNLFVLGDKTNDLITGA